MTQRRRPNSIIKLAFCNARRLLGWIRDAARKAHGLEIGVRS